MENPGSELIIFDVNRMDRIAFFIPAANESPLLQLEARANLPYRLTVISNSSDNSAQVTQRIREPHANAIDFKPLQMSWPTNVYSLTHVAIPLAPDDPVYGTGNATGATYQGIPLGALQPRGETHLLVTSLNRLMRLRYNPFFAYVENRVAVEIDKVLQYDKGGNPTPN